MRYAVISDVHANLEALTAVLAEIDASGVDRIICPGDLVGYYTDPNEVIALLRERKVLCIAGNHDRMAIGAKEPVRCTESARRAMYWTRTQLTSDSLSYLSSLRASMVVDDQILMVHASLHPEPNDDRYLTSSRESRLSFDGMRQGWPNVHVCFFGHTHRSAVYASRENALLSRDCSAITLQKGERYLINPGSVGQPRDGDERAAFLLYDSERLRVEFLRVPFDNGSVESKVRRAGIFVGPSITRRVARWFSRGGEMLMGTKT